MPSICAATLASKCSCCVLLTLFKWQIRPFFSSSRWYFIIWKVSHLCFYLNLTYAGNSLACSPSGVYLFFHPHLIHYSCFFSTLSVSNINWLHLSCKQIHVTSPFINSPVFSFACLVQRKHLFFTMWIIKCFFYHVRASWYNCRIHLDSNYSPPVPAGLMHAIVLSAIRKESTGN